MWNLEDALVLIRELQPKLREIDYHIMLGGSILNTGTSDKDLDLFFAPLNGYEPNRENIFNFLAERFGPLRSLRDVPDYGPDSFPHWSEMQMGHYQGKRIDIFIKG